MFTVVLELACDELARGVARAVHGVLSAMKSDSPMRLCLQSRGSQLRESANFAIVH